MVVLAWGSSSWSAGASTARLEDCCGPSHATFVQAAVRCRARFYGALLCCPRPTSRRGTRVPPPLLVPGEPLRGGPAGAEECQSGFRLGSHRESACSGAGLSGKKRVGSHQKCTTDERRTVLSIIRTDGIDLDSLDAVAQLLLGSLTAALAQSVRIENASAAALRKKWATAADRRGTRAAARTAARTARTELILRRATPCRCAVGASPIMMESRGSYPHRNPSASRRRSRAPSASSTSS